MAVVFKNISFLSLVHRKKAVLVVVVPVLSMSCFCHLNILSDQAYSSGSSSA